MDSATCPSCGKSLQPGAVVCIECGFDLRTGQALETDVGPSATGPEQLDDQERLDLCQLQGVGTKILVYGRNEEVVAYLHARAHPFWTCLTVLVAVPLFFLVPFGLGFAFVAVAEWAKMPPPGTLLAIILLTLAFAIGLFAAFCTARLMTPRRRFRVWEDESRERLLMRVVETWKFGVAKVAVRGADGQPLGRILHHRRRGRYMIVDQLDRPRAVLLSKKIEYTSEWANESVAYTLVLFLLLGLPGLLLAILPKKERSYSESFLYQIASFEEQATEQLGRVTFNPARENPYRVELADDPDRTVDRKLVVALMGLLEW